ncbi:TnsA endonuclease N-terminal domain-containing protein [Tenacibaculum sp. Mcav3-52]|uniref:TnsA endonuclease N-terminal domain-containing protein n=1 Tax=Tenacibaculum sp. Mcav3-52 TaxID=2917762 RepID=UPI001EF201C7|nr:TnsA endonuclease N-terminal domain-containing protein [Tenacibaculum sp. Mcav3-52]MCG7501077.1 TnsA endonuclease N-terminal domain-containing protein [Tenacibaculum sp. Mcav3-52]
MIKNTTKTREILHKKMINSYLDDEFYSFFTEEAIISLKKARRIGLKNFSLSGNIVSLKMNDLISFESSLERDYIHLLEFNSSVVTYSEQPLKIFFSVGTKKYYYVPDFYVKFNDGRKDEIIEVKYKDDLEKNKSKYQNKFKAAKLFCESNNMKFRVIDETQIRTTQLINCKFLLPYRRIKNGIDYLDVVILEERIKHFEFATPKNIINDSFFSEDRKAELLYTLWYMIANDMVSVNLDKKITMNSQIKVL